GFDSNSFGVGVFDCSDSTMRIGGSVIGTGTGSCVSTHIVAVALDFGTQKAWARVWNGSSWGNWNNNASGDPVAEVGGFSFSTVAGTATYYIGFGSNTPTEGWT